MTPDEAKDNVPTHLMILPPGTAFLVPLPAAGEVYLGSDGDRPIRVRQRPSEAMSARVVVDSGGVWIGTINGSEGLVTVNGGALEGRRPLACGDRIRVGPVEVELGLGPDAKPASPVVRLPELRRHLRNELERCVRYQRSLALLCVRFTQSPPDLERVGCQIVDALRAIDLVAESGPDELLVLLPESGSNAAVPGNRVRRALAGQHPDIRLGLACCPLDATQVKPLIQAARHAAERAAPGTLRRFRTEGKTLRVGRMTVVARDPLMRRTINLVQELARSDIPVLVLGETGVGKEVMARALHEWSARNEARMVCINCASLPDTLLYSELFGYERGAFSGAHATKPGLFETAAGGTLFLDEVGNASARTQAELLRVLDTRRIRRLGSLREREVDIRVVAATNSRLAEEVTAGRFRADLFYRLNAATVTVPPLRRRPQDLPLLLKVLLADECARAGRTLPRLSEPAVRMLSVHRWPGNVRQLRNVLANLVATVHDRTVGADAVRRVFDSAQPLLSDILPADTAPRAASADTGEPGPNVEFRPIRDELAELEARRMAEALSASAGVRVEAARLIQMPLRTFVSKINKYGLADHGKTGTASTPKES